MISMTLAAIAEVVGGEAHGEATVTGPAFFDSRAVEPGGLFLAVVGERVDGHEYAAGAVAAGCRGGARLPADRGADRGGGRPGGRARPAGPARP